MSFLKTIQKRQSEFPKPEDEFVTQSQEGVSAPVNRPPGLLSMPDLRIGAPGTVAASAAVDAPAKPDTVTNGNSRPKEIVPVDPAMIREVQAAREIMLNPEHVNPRLVAITQPRSPYCEEYRNLR